MKDMWKLCFLEVKFGTDLNGITRYKEYGYYKDQVTDPKWPVNVINKMLLVMTTVQDCSIVQIVILLLI